MDDFLDDIEAGVPFQTPRSTNKKKKKRKQLDALIRFRIPRINRSTKEIIRSSEDELFLPNHKHLLKKSPFYNRRWWNYTRHILSFCLVCIFMIVCVGLAYANIELKTEVQNLSLRVTNVEKRFSNIEINRVISTLEQIKNRLNLLERWNTTYLHNRLQKLQGDFYQLNKKSPPSTEISMAEEDGVDVSSKLDNMEQKSTQFSEVANELDKLSHDAEEQFHDKTKPYDKNLIEQLLQSQRNEKSHQNIDQLVKNLLLFNETLRTNTIQWNEELTSLRNELHNVNQTIQIQQLTDLVHNSTNKTLSMIMTLQSNVNQLRKQIETCKCTNPNLNQTIEIAQTINQP